MDWGWIGLGALVLFGVSEGTGANTVTDNSGSSGGSHNGDHSGRTPSITPTGNGYTPKLGTEGGLTESYLGLRGAPRGVSNNNPGNIILTNITWAGKIPNAQNTDTNNKFEQFYSWPYGVRAMTKLLGNYLDNGYNTIDKIINRYTSNNANYKAFVARRLGVTITTPLNNDYTTLKALVQALARFENGHPIGTPEVITSAQFGTAYQLL